MVQADGSVFTFSPIPGGTNYIVTNNGVAQDLDVQSANGFTTRGTQHAGDAVTLRDLTACNWVFQGNILGTSLADGSYSESPYPGNNVILDGAEFTSIFTNWQYRSGGDYALTAASGYRGTATDAAKRA